jgi:hypothetical protein
MPGSIIKDTLYTFATVVLAVLALIALSDIVKAEGGDWPRFDSAAPATARASVTSTSKRSKDCLPLHPNLRDGLSQAGDYGDVVITSVCTGSHASKSWHYRNDGRHSLAVDFRVLGSRWKSAAKHLGGWPGGFASYGGGLFHIDAGPYRRWR